MDEEMKNKCREIGHDCQSCPYEGMCQNENAYHEMVAKAAELKENGKSWAEC